MKIYNAINLLNSESKILSLAFVLVLTMKKNEDELLLCSERLNLYHKLRFLFNRTTASEKIKWK